MSGSYQGKARRNKPPRTSPLEAHGQEILPFVELVEQSRMAVGELIDAMGRSALETVLRLSAEKVAGPRHPGRAGGPVRWHGSQAGVVPMAERKIRIQRPRLRDRQAGEVPVPAYEALREGPGLGRRMLSILMAGVSTRRYAGVIPAMAETVGVSKSAVSREVIEAGEEALKTLLERRLDGLDLLVIYVDGMVFGEHHIITAVGVDAQGRKHVLGIVHGATENAAAVKDLFSGMIARGLKGGRRRLWVIDGSKALRKAIDEIFGDRDLVQRCRIHKIRNVVEHLPCELRSQVRAAMRAAYRLEPKEGMARLRKQAGWLQGQYPSAAASLEEGLEETFTINHLALTPALRRSLGTTNLIENPNSGVRRRTRRVTRWKDGAMALRWAASSLLDLEKGLRRIMGYKDLWMLAAVLDDNPVPNPVDNSSEAA